MKQLIALFRNGKPKAIKPEFYDASATAKSAQRFAAIMKPVAISSRP